MWTFRFGSQTEANLRTAFRLDHSAGLMLGTRHSSSGEATRTAAAVPRQSVLVLATYLTRDQAGAAHSTITIIDALARAPWADVTVAAFTWDQSLLPSNVRLIRLPEASWTDSFWRFHPLSDYWHAIRALQTEPLADFDMCYTQNIPLGLAFRRSQPDTPIVSHPGAILWEREVLEESTAPMRWRRLSARFARWLESRTYHQPHWQHFASSSVVAAIRADSFGIAKDLFEVAPLPVDPLRFDPSKVRRDIRPELGFAADDFVVIVVARLIQWKRVDAVIRAIANQPTHVALLVVGDGPEEIRLQSLARDLGVTDRVRFVGRQDPVPYLAAANVFVLPSSIESFGLAYVEAMLMGLPCVGLRNNPPDVLSAAGEVIGDGDFGFCVSSDDELRQRIEALSADPAACRQLGARARSVALDRFTPDRYIARLRDIAVRARR